MTHDTHDTPTHKQMATETKSHVLVSMHPPRKLPTHRTIKHGHVRDDNASNAHAVPLEWAKRLLSKQENQAHPCQASRRTHPTWRASAASIMANQAKPRAPTPEASAGDNREGLLHESPSSAGGSGEREKRRRGAEGGEARALIGQRHDDHRARASNQCTPTQTTKKQGHWHCIFALAAFWFCCFGPPLRCMRRALVP